MRELVNSWRSARQEGVWNAVLGLGRDVPRVFLRHTYFLYFRCCQARKATGNVGEIAKIYIDPREIKWVAMLSAPLVELYGPRAIVGTVPGSWDRFCVPIESTTTFKKVNAAWQAGGKHSLLESMANGYRETFAPRKKYGT